MKSITKYVLVISTGVILAITLSACGHHVFHASPEERAEYLVKHISDDLDLNETQNASLNALKTELLSLRTQMKKEHEASRNALLEILSQPTLDRERTVNLIQKHLQTLQDQTPQIIAATGDFYDGLTVEQQQTLRKKIEKRTEKTHRFGYGH